MKQKNSRDFVNKEAYFFLRMKFYLTQYEGVQIEKD